MQRGANGLTVDDGSRLGKKLDCVLLGKASPPPPCHLLREGNSLSALPLWGTATGAHLNFGPSLVCGYLTTERNFRKTW